jgi:uncharacterized membrane protein
VAWVRLGWWLVQAGASCCCYIDVATLMNDDTTIHLRVDH